MHDVIYLLSETHSFDDYGNDVSEFTETEVFAEVQSITQTEFFSASQSDLRPDYKFVIYTAEYNNERMIKYNGVIYNVYRSYMRNEEKIELYVNKKIGVPDGTD